MKRRVIRMIAVMLAAVIMITPSVSVDVYADEIIEENVDEEKEVTEPANEDGEVEMVEGADDTLIDEPSVKDEEQQGEPVIDDKKEEGEPVVEEGGEPVVEEGGEPVIEEGGEPVIEEGKEPVVEEAGDVVPGKEEEGEGVPKKAKAEIMTKKSSQPDTVSGDYYIYLKIDSGSGDVVVNGRNLDDLEEKGGYRVYPAEDGEEIILTAIDGDGYRFYGWEDDLGRVISIDRDIMFEANKDCYYIANFSSDNKPYEGSLTLGYGDNDTLDLGEKTIPYTIDPDWNYELISYNNWNSNYLYFKKSDMEITGDDAFVVEWGEEFYCLNHDSFNMKVMIKENLSPGDYRATVTLNERDSVIDPVKFDLKVRIVGDFTIETAVSPKGAGTATGGGDITFPNKATLKATPKENYTFVGWYLGNDLVSKDATYTFKPKSDGKYTAKFTPTKYKVVVKLKENYGGKVSGGGTFDPGTKVTITAEPPEGYSFGAWYDSAGNKISTSAKYAFTPKSDVTYLASFDKITSQKNIKNATVKGIENKTYTGKALTQKITVVLDNTTLRSGTDYDVAYKNNTNPGTATLTITGKGKYKGSVSKSFKIAKATQKITASNFTKYVGNKAFAIGAKTNGGGTLSYSSANTKVATVDAKKGTVTIKAAGTAKITIKATETKNYAAASTTITVTVKNPASISKAKISNLKNKAYTGKAITQNPVVKLGSKTLKSGTDYTVSYSKNKAVGTATVIITGKNAYKGTAKATFKIVKANNPIKVKAKKARVDYFTVRKKAVTVAAKNAMTVSGAQGKVTYKKVKGNVLITVSSAGVITVPKGAPGGTYNITIQVTAAGNSSYKAGSQTVVVPISVL